MLNYAVLTLVISVDTPKRLEESYFERPVDIHINVLQASYVQRRVDVVRIMLEDYPAVASTVMERLADGWSIVGCVCPACWNSAFLSVASRKDN